MSAWQCIIAAYCDMALLFFIENEPPLPEVKHRASGFFCSGWFQLYSNFIPTLFQLYSNFIPTLFQLFGKTEHLWSYCEVELFKITLEPCNYFKALYIKYCSNFIVHKIQLNRAKFIFNRAKKKKPNTREGVRLFPTSKRTTIKWWSNIDDLQVSE